MSGKILTELSHIDRKIWETLVQQSSTANIFQTPQMVDFYNAIGLYEIVISAIEIEGSLKGVVVCLIQSEGKGLKRRVTSRGIINGGPMFADDISEEEVAALLFSIKEQLKHRCIYIESRNLNDYSKWRVLFEQCGFDYVPHYNFHIDTTSVELVEKRMDRGRRRRVKKSFENHVVVSEDSGDVCGFYQILKDLYKNKVHKPLPPFEFFDGLKDKPFAKYFIIKEPSGQTIGGQLILMLDRRCAYAWYCCGLDKEYHDLFPSIMANYVAIRYAAENGFLRYDMMGAGSPDKDYGVRDFKAQFGGDLVEHGRFLFLCKPFVYKIGSHVMKLLTKKATKSK